MANREQDLDAAHIGVAHPPVDEAEARYRTIFEQTRDGLVINDLNTGLVVEANAAFCAIHGYRYEEMIGQHPTTFVHPDSHHLFQAYMAAITNGESFQCQAVDVRKDGSLVPVEVHGGAIFFHGKPHVLGVVRDVTERVESQEQLERRVAERTRELSTLLEVSRDVASTLELEPLLRLILAQLARVVSFIGAAIFERQGDDLVVLTRRTPGPDAQAGPDRYPLQRALPLWERIERGESLVIDDVRGDDSLARSYRALVGDLVDSTFADERSWMAIPLVTKDRAIGAVTLSGSTSHEFTTHHAQLAQAIANQAAIAIENARLYGRAQEVAAMEERQRLARELHDSVTQSLYSVTLYAEAASRLLAADRIEPAREHVQAVRETAQEALQEMRLLIFELRPPEVERDGLIGALRSRLDAVEKRSGLTVHLAVDAHVALPALVEDTLYRLSVEALNNVLKHAHARTVSIALRPTEHGVCLLIGDDGVGFDVEAARGGGGLGLPGMEERAAQLGARLELVSRPGDGTTVRIEVTV